MPYYPRSRSAYSYGRRRWRRTGWYRSYGRGRRGLRSSNYTSGRRRMTLRVPCEAQVQFTINAGDNWSTLGCIQPYMSFKSSSAGRGLGIAPLVLSPLYRQYCMLYDEVKVDSVNVNGSIIDGIGIGGTFSGLSFCSSWDRRIEPGEIIPTGKPGITPSTIQFGSESQSYLLTNNSRQLVHRWNRASDIQERTTFHDCSVASGVSGSYLAYYDEAFVPMDSSLNISSSCNIGYVPGLWMAFYSPLVDSSNARYVNVTFKVVYTVTFRNPKYGLSAEANAKGVEDIKVEPVKSEGFGVVTKSIKSADIVSASARLKAARDEFVSGGLSSSKVDSLYEDFKIVYEGLGEETFKEIFNEDFSQFVNKYKREEKDVGDLGDDDVLMGDLPEVKEA